MLSLLTFVRGWDPWISAIEAVGEVPAAVRRVEPQTAGKVGNSGSTLGGFEFRACFGSR